MNINTLTFLGYSIIIAIIINLIKSPKLKNYVLLASSNLFYLIFDYKYIILMISMIMLSYCIALKIPTSKYKYFSILGLSPIILVLIFYKWFGFFYHNSMDISSILIPLGLSYYSFKILSYLTDVSLGKYPPSRDFISYYNYVAFFPQIICGPIARVNELYTQLNNLSSPASSQVAYGIYLIILGLFKKIVIADRIAPYVNNVFSAPADFPGTALWLAAILYTFEIYCDFAGYSEIVIGICNLMGIYCTPNFNLPYLSFSISDFWKRWHISLSSWLRDYIYIPLGGNKRGFFRKIINTIIVFIISGIWHGNGITYIIWGLWHGLLNIIPVKKSKNKLIFHIQILITFILVMFGWIIFNSTSITSFLSYISLMFTNTYINMNGLIATILPFTNDYSCLSHFTISIGLILFLFIMETVDYKKTDLQLISYKRVVILIICIVLLGTWGQNSFIYSNF